MISQSLLFSMTSPFQYAAAEAALIGQLIIFNITSPFLYPAAAVLLRLNY